MVLSINIYFYIYFQEINYITIYIVYRSLYTMTKRQYLSIENEEQRVVWSGLSSPLQHVLYVQELQLRETHKFNYREMRVTHSKVTN